MKPLEVRGLGFSYEDGTMALKDLSMSLDEGEKVAIVGPNGAGKSTLLHLIAGFRMPFSGEILIGGVPLTESSADELRKQVGLLFQDPDDQIFMPTVEEDVAFGPMNLGLDDTEGRVSRALRSSGIENLAKRRPHNLSFGMKKRVAIAGIMAMDPEILLLDEPTSGLDPRSRSELIALLKGMDRSMLIASHDIEAVSEIADRAVVLNTSIVMQGTMFELVSSREVLIKNGLEMPSISKLFTILEAMGYDVGSLPISMDQAAAELIKIIESEGKHLHAHIHEHGHRAGETQNAHAHSHRHVGKERPS
jgi:cobalt/nickel transport system ATP-binding protein